jgi:hypothetical protein
MTFMRYMVAALAASMVVTGCGAENRSEPAAVPSSAPTRAAVGESVPECAEAQKFRFRKDPVVRFGPVNRGKSTGIYAYAYLNREVPRRLCGHTALPELRVNAFYSDVRWFRSSLHQPCYEQPFQERRDAVADGERVVVSLVFRHKEIDTRHVVAHAVSPSSLDNDETVRRFLTAYGCFN